MDQRIVLIPNCSLTPRSAVFFFSTIFAVSLTFSLFFVFQGLWLVLPFWGLEMGVLGVALHWSLKRRHHRQEVLVTDSEIRIVTISQTGSQNQQFSRHWAKVKLHTPRTNLHPSRLMIESHGRAFEVGRFLTEEERRSLAHRLQALVGRLNESPPIEVMT